MAERMLYIGSTGPYLFDDEVDVDPVNFPGVKQGAIVTDGEATITVVNAEQAVVAPQSSYDEVLKRSFVQ